MSTATIDKPTSTEKIGNEDLESKINNIIEQDSKNQNREDLSYYYSSGNFNFILEHGFKPETLETTELTKVPFLPKWYDGIISIHGLIMPVIDILKFAKSQNLDVVSDPNKKNYLLKLEHADHKPIVFKLDSIPQLVNMKQLEKLDTANDTPEWVKNYLQNDTIKLALVDHNKLFDQLISEQ